MLKLTAIVLITSLSACTQPSTTDIDYIGQEFADKRPDLEYQPNCKKPKAFRGAEKFNVDCIVSVSPEAWILENYNTHSSFVGVLRSSGYSHVGSTTAPRLFVKPGNAELPIQVFQKPTETLGCYRRIYLDASAENVTKKKKPLGNRIIIADPRVLSCTTEKLN